MFWTDSKDWKKIAEDIRNERKVLFGNEPRPIPVDISGMFFNIQNRLKSEVSFDERKDICELLFEIYQELNTLKPMGRDYKKCFDTKMVEMFIETLKKANDYNGKNFTSYITPVIGWLENNYFNGKAKVKTADHTR